MFQSSMDVRWKQRFQNFDKSLDLLTQAMNIENPDVIQKAGLIQFFEMTFELAWKTIKDYLHEQGFTEINTPRNVFKKAYEVELIRDGHVWLKLLEDRNLTSHTYDENTANAVIDLISKKYFDLLKSLHKTFKLKLDEQ